MKKEFSVGLLAFACLILLVWGFNFLKGFNIFKQSFELIVEYENIDGMQVSTPVTINGFQVGKVKSIEISSQDLQTIVATLDFSRDINLPQNTKAVLVANGVLGDKAILLDYDGVCNANCLKSGAVIKGETKGLLASMTSVDEVQTYVDVIQSGVGGIVDSLKSKIMEDGTVDGLSNDLEATLRQMNRSTLLMARILEKSADKFDNILSHLEGITESVAIEKEALRKSISNIETLTNQLAQIRLDSTVQIANETFESAEKSLKELESLITDINNGKGTLGKLANEELLYENLEDVTTELNYLLKDFRLNPKRYINVSVFGKKGDPYTLPTEDPLDSLGRQ